MKISIIGAAGSVGSSVAFNIAVQGLADEIVMLDPRQNFLLHHAWDIATAAVGQDIVVRAGKYEDIRSSDIIIVTAGTAQRPEFTSRREVLSANLPIIRDIASRIKQYCPKAIVITATVPLEAMNYAMHLTSGIDRHRLLGYSLNDTMRFREALSYVLKVKASHIHCAVIGEHGDSQVMLFSSVKVDGKPFPIDAETRLAVKQKIMSYFPEHAALKTLLTSGWTSAVGIATMVRAVSKNTGETIPCSVVLDGEYGCKGFSMTVPAVLGKNGVQKVLEWQLDAEEQKELEASINIIRPFVQYVEENLK